MAILKYCPNIAAYQIWEESANNFSLYKHFKKLDRQTTDRQTDRQTDKQTQKFFLHFLTPRGPKRREKKF